MKVSKIFGAFAALSLIATSAFFVSCSNDDDTHEHTFATTYTSNATHHWHAATCEHKTEVKDKAEHSFGEWKSNNDASVTEDGTKTRICSVCGYNDTVTDEGTKIEIVATPVFSPASSAVNSGTSVTITCTTEGAKIYYTTDGTDPTVSSTEYTAAISVTPPMTIKAIAVKDGMNDSAVASASYTIKETVATPAFSVDAWKVESGTSVTISCTTEGAKIYYTIDGSVPTAASTEYTAAISVTEAVTIKAIAVKDGMNDSAVASASYTIKETVATPAFRVASGEVDSGTGITITCATEFATIYYTTDGSVPTSSSTEYTAAIFVTEAVTIKAIAVKYEMNDSAVASVSYTTINPFVLIPAGTFQMGCNQIGYKEQVHTVTLTKAFYMCDHEVTQAEYEAVMGKGSNPSKFVGEDEDKKAAEGEVQENRPVDNVSWYKAIVYCNKRSIKEGLTPCYTISGKTDPADWGRIPTSRDETWDAVECNWTANGYRLPTEAEWEYAARAGDETVDSITWSGTNAEASLGDYAWYMSGVGEKTKTHEVKKKNPNVYKLYDMSGNVCEWCWDWGNYYSEAATTDPRGDTSGSCRVLRNGGYNFLSGGCAVSYRQRYYPDVHTDDLGFRVCRSATTSE